MCQKNSSRQHIEDNVLLMLSSEDSDFLSLWTLIGDVSAPLRSQFKVWSDDDVVSTWDTEGQIPAALSSACLIRTGLHRGLKVKPVKPVWNQQRAGSVLRVFTVLCSGPWSLLPPAGCCSQCEPVSSCCTHITSPQTLSQSPDSSPPGGEQQCVLGKEELIK